MLLLSPRKRLDVRRSRHLAVVCCFEQMEQRLLQLELQALREGSTSRQMEPIRRVVDHSNMLSKVNAHPTVILAVRANKACQG